MICQVVYILVNLKLLQTAEYYNFGFCVHVLLTNIMYKIIQVFMDVNFLQIIWFDDCILSYDNQGLPTSTLRLPINIALEGNSGYDATSVTVGALASQGDHNEEPFGRYMYTYYVKHDTFIYCMIHCIQF